MDYNLFLCIYLSVSVICNIQFYKKVPTLPCILNETVLCIFKCTLSIILCIYIAHNILYVFVIIDIFNFIYRAQYTYLRISLYIFMIYLYTKHCNCNLSIYVHCSLISICCDRNKKIKKGFLKNDEKNKIE